MGVGWAAMRGRGGGAALARKLRWRAPAAALLASVLASGCVLSPAPYLPATWGESGPSAPWSLAHQPPRLQAIISYGGLTSSHAALRLQTAEGRVVFWDPAGDYGRWQLEVNPRFAGAALPARRVADRIQDPPDLEGYVRFRWALDDVGVEVFEWDLDASQADALHEALLGRGRDARGHTFSTLTAAPFCTVALSRFLRRFGSPAIRLRGTYFFPHRLAQALYRATPSRVLIFQPDGRSRVHEPPADATALGRSGRGVASGPGSPALRGDSPISPAARLAAEPGFPARPATISRQ
jgi:hypothetical protein